MPQAESSGGPTRAHRRGGLDRLSATVAPSIHSPLTITLPTPQVKSEGDSRDLVQKPQHDV